MRGKKTVTITPGMVGLVGAINVPCVFARPGPQEFLCVDFIIDCCVFRVRPYYNQVKLLKEVEKPEAYQFCGKWTPGRCPDHLKSLVDVTTY
jgi:hypothetical protein